MNIQRSKLKHIAVFLAGISAASVSVVANADWSIKILENLGGNNRATAVNDSGQVVWGDPAMTTSITLSSPALTVLV